VRDGALTRRTIDVVFTSALAIGLAMWIISRVATSGEGDYTAINAVLMVLAFTKAALIITYYMEVRWAPPYLKAICAGWLVVTCTAIIVASVVPS
jgi:hypothetical protein